MMVTAEGRLVGAGTAASPAVPPAGIDLVSTEVRQARLAARRQRRKAAVAAETPEQREARLRGKRDEYARNKRAASARSLAKYYTDDVCREKAIKRSRERYAAAKSAGLCTVGNCGCKRIGSHNRCERHWWVAAAVRLKLGSKRAAELKARIAGLNFECFYTGLGLSPAATLSFDHVVPRSSADFPGYADMSNIVPCHRNVNIMKNNLPANDFIQLCQLVADKRKGHNKCP